MHTTRSARTRGTRILGMLAAAVTCAAIATPAAGAQSVSFTIGGPAPCEQTSPAQVEQLISEIHEHTNRVRAEAGAPPSPVLILRKEISTRCGRAQFLPGLTLWWTCGKITSRCFTSGSSITPVLG